MAKKNKKTKKRKNSNYKPAVDQTVKSEIDRIEEIVTTAAVMEAQKGVKLRKKRFQNPILASQEAKLEYGYRARLNVLLQMAEDACVMSTADVRGLGQENAALLRQTFRQTINAISELLVEDSKDDADIVYSRAKVDKRLEQIEGPNAREWDDRYAWTERITL